MTTTTETIDVTSWIDRLVAFLKEAGALHSPAVEAAFRRVPRHRLLEDYFAGTENGWVKQAYEPKHPRLEDLDFFYADNPIVTRISEEMPSSSTSQPKLVAGMLELLELTPGLKVLEIGAGTGYNAALMAELVADQSLVVAVDIQKDIIAQTGRLLADIGYSGIKLLACDGSAGVPEDAPYDRIVATVGCPDLSLQWATQLKPTGFMLIPLLFGGWHPLVKVWLEQDRLKGKFVANAGFMLIQGELHMTGLWPFPYALPFVAEGFQELSDFEHLDTASLRDFYDFIVLRDRRAFWTYNPATYGLYEEERGAVVIHSETGAVLFKGDPVLYDDLHKLYTEWQAAGKPQRSDYELEFIPLTQALSPFSEFTWMIERKFYRQVFRLSKTATTDS
jgi:protein-L-isoaspartate(D-aspartate) O-methyltransferase